MLVNSFMVVGMVELKVVVWYIMDFLEEVYWILLFSCFIVFNILFVDCDFVDLKVSLFMM